MIEKRKRETAAAAAAVADADHTQFENSHFTNFKSFYKIREF